MNKDFRMYVRGTEENCKEFTIDLTWYHSAAAGIGSIVKNDETGAITLNLIADRERKEDIERWAKKFNCEVVEF